MPAYQFDPDDGMGRYYSDRGVWFQPGEIADWPDPPDAHWAEPKAALTVPIEPDSVPKKSGGGKQ